MLPAAILAVAQQRRRIWQMPVPLQVAFRLGVGTPQQRQPSHSLGVFFFSELLRANTGIATYNGVTPRLFAASFAAPSKPLRRMGGTGLLNISSTTVIGKLFSRSGPVGGSGDGPGSLMAMDAEESSQSATSSSSEHEADSENEVRIFRGGYAVFPFSWSANGKKRRVVVVLCYS